MSEPPSPGPTWRPTSTSDRGGNAKPLGKRIARGGIVLIVLRLALKCIGLVSLALLFRILTPEDFGIVAAAMLVVGFIELFGDYGFEQSLLRDADSTLEDYHLVWTLNAIRGACVSLLLLAAAPWAAAFLKEPRLEAVIAVLALVPLIDGLQSVGVVDFAKRLQFEREFQLKVSQKLLSFVVTLGFALVLRNYWALVIGLIAGRLLNLALGYAMHPYRPRPRLTGWQGVFRFSSWILATNIVLFAGNQTDKVLVQRAFDAQTLGIMRIAEEISGMVMESVWSIERALYAGYVAVAHEAERLRRTVIEGTGAAASLGMPLAALLGVLAEPAVRLILGPKAAPAVPYVQVFVLYGAVRSCGIGITPLFMVLNRPALSTQVVFASTGVRLIVLLTGFSLFGLMTVPWSLVASGGVMVALLWWWSVRLGVLRAIDVPLAVWRPLVATLLMALVMNLLLGAVQGTLNALAQLLLVGGLGVAIYVGSALLLWRLVGSPQGPERAAIDFLRARFSQRA
jgi:O-antigen/teichoic acid export membrane protein